MKALTNWFWKFYYGLFSGGGTGFIGKALVDILKRKGHEVTLISRTRAPGRITWVRVKNKLIWLYFLRQDFINYVCIMFIRLNAQLRVSWLCTTGGSLRFVAGGRQDSAPRHISGHVLNKYNCVEGPGLKTAGCRWLCPALNESPDTVNFALCNTSNTYKTRECFITFPNTLKFMSYRQTGLKMGIR